jgi:hypothetical protein
MQHICGSTREEDPHLVAVAKAVPAMAERLRTTAVTVEAGNAATVTALADLRAELAEVKASLQDFVQRRFSFTFTPARSRMLPQGWDPLLSQGQGRPVSSPSLPGRLPQTPQSLAPPPPVPLGGQLPPVPPWYLLRLRPLVQTLARGVHNPRSLAEVDGWSRRRSPLHR